MNKMKVRSLSDKFYLTLADGSQVWVSHAHEVHPVTGEVVVDETMVFSAENREVTSWDEMSCVAGNDPEGALLKAGITPLDLLLGSVEQD